MPTLYSISVETGGRSTRNPQFIPIKIPGFTEIFLAEDRRIGMLTASDAKKITSFIIDNINNNLKAGTIFCSLGQELNSIYNLAESPRYFRLKRTFKDIIDVTLNDWHAGLNYYDSWLCQPLLEGIYESDPDSFYDIIDALIKQEVSDKKRQEFIMCLQELPSSISPEYLMKHEALGCEKLERAISDLEDYNSSRKQDNDSQVVELLIEKLREKKTSLDKYLTEKTPNLQTQLNILKLKLEMKGLIKKQAPTISNYQAYQYLLTNIVSALCAFIPNIINYAASGSFLFFSKTDFHERVEKIDRALTIEPPRNLVS